jgi:hypothetical protein
MPRESIDDVVSQVVDDLRAGLGDWLRQEGDDSPAVRIELAEADASPEEVVTASDGFVALPWTCTGQHVGPLLGVPATFLPLEVRGITVVDTRPDREAWRYHRSIDFLSVLHQLGVGVGRPALEADDFVAWFEQAHPERDSSSFAPSPRS